MKLDQVKQKMQRTIEVVKDDVATIRAGRATPAMVEKVPVKAYGGTQNLSVMEMASIHAEDLQTLVIRPWDQSVIGEIAKGINSANLGVSAVIDGEIVRIKVPPLTEDRRREFVRMLGTKIENGKVAVRQVRHEAMSDVKQAFEKKEISEDDKFRLEKEIQKLTDEMMGVLEGVAKQKEDELMKV